MSDTSTPLPRHWETGQPFDWRDYIKIGKGFTPEFEADLRKTYDELAAVPEFQERLIQSKSPEIRKEWEACAYDALTACQQRIDFCQKNQFADSKQAITHFRKQKESIAKRLFSQDTRVLVKPRQEGGDAFDPVHRIVYLNPKQLLKDVYYGERPDKQGDEIGEPLVSNAEGRTQYHTSLQHSACHEHIHSSRSNTYRFSIAMNRVRKIMSDKGYERPHEMTSEDLSLNKELFAEKIEENYTIALTNRIMQHYYGEERREGHTGKTVKSKAVTHMSVMESPSVSISLPVLTNERNGKPVQISKPEYTVAEMEEIILNGLTKDSPNIYPSHLKSWAMLRVGAS